MSTNDNDTVAIVEKPKPVKKLKPARKQVKAGEVERKETPQTGKEYSKCDTTRLARQAPC